MTRGLVISEHRLRNLADRGLSKAEMAEFIGVDKTAIERSLREHGINLDGSHGPPKGSKHGRAAWEADPEEVFGRDSNA